MTRATTCAIHGLFEPCGECERVANHRPVVVTGGRSFADHNAVARALEAARPTLIVQGGATGADELARQWAICNNVPLETWPAAWQRDGASAGPRRNAAMLRANERARVLAFPGGRGTADCVRRALAMGMEVVEVTA